MNFYPKGPPAAEKLRPIKIEDIVGHQQLLGKSGLIDQLVKAQHCVSLLFWGPPGCGKTTLARMYALAFSSPFISLSGVFSGVSEIKSLVADIKSRPLFSGKTIVFIDEIHRFNKAQQDALLPYVEDGTFILLGATTENPSFSLNSALLSRLRIVQMSALESKDLLKIFNRFENIYGSLNLPQDCIELLIQSAQGDARYLINLMEVIFSAKLPNINSAEELKELIQIRAPLMDNQGDQHYNLISAFHKSVRGSDPDASLYYLARMINAGMDPLFIARRMIRIANEDVGLADPTAITQCINAQQSFQHLGAPEGHLSLAQAAVYLALAPKSNSLYKAYNQAMEDAKQTNYLNPPKIILNAPTKMMKDLEYGKGYQYDHDQPYGFSGQEYFPKELGHKKYYFPKEIGLEREMSKRVKYFENLREQILNNFTH